MSMPGVNRSSHVLFILVRAADDLSLIWFIVRWPRLIINEVSPAPMVHERRMPVTAARDNFQAVHGVWHAHFQHLECSELTRLVNYSLLCMKKIGTTTMAVDSLNPFQASTAWHPVHLGPGWYGYVHAANSCQQGRP